MQVAVWDTYVKKQDGSVLHFDILVPADKKDAAAVFEFGKMHLAARNEPAGKLESEECQLCHIEDPGPEVLESIRRQGFYILEMEDIPAELPPEPARRELILHLRAHYPEHRFADFSAKGLDEIRDLALNARF